ncbi:hypothetical protein RKLH11_4250 [Rhodobacteraceae bacterium KLH11]|nr:hypothetical protein RKLH11_4250 [Rhodobacteraceae bacterium KLH11]
MTGKGSFDTFASFRMNGGSRYTYYPAPSRSRPLGIQKIKTDKRRRYAGKMDSDCVALQD